MKQIFKWTSLLAALVASCVLSAAAGDWHLGKRMGAALLLVQNTVFVSQFQALKELQDGSNSRALEYLRVRNQTLSSIKMTECKT